VLCLRIGNSETPKNHYFFSFEVGSIMALFDEALPEFLRYLASCASCSSSASTSM